MRMTPRRFFDAARSGWRASMASSCFSASGNLPASKARYAVLYISSNSALVGATLSAANEVSPSAAIAAIFQILANQSTVAEDGAGTHCLNRRFTDGTMWLFQRQPREQRCSLV